VKDQKLYAEKVCIKNGIEIGFEIDRRDLMKQFAEVLNRKALSSQRSRKRGTLRMPMSM